MTSFQNKADVRKNSKLVPLLPHCGGKNDFISTKSKGCAREQHNLKLI